MTTKSIGISGDADSGGIATGSITAPGAAELRRELASARRRLALWRSRRR